VIFREGYSSQNSARRFFALLSQYSGLPLTNVTCDMTLMDGNQLSERNAIDTCLWRLSYHFVAFVSIASVPSFSSLLDKF
jgi:hypothetical protein